MTSYEAYNWGDFFTIDTTINYQITKKDSNQRFLFAFSKEKPNVNYYEDEFTLNPLSGYFRGIIIYIKNFDTMHVGWFESQNITENEILSRGKACKLSSRNKTRIDLNISFKVKTFGVYMLDARDSTLRTCSQFTDFENPGPLFISVAASDDYGFSQTTLSKYL